MQPQEPTAVPAPTPPPGWAPSGAPPELTKKPPRRLRLWLAITGGILALLCLGGVGIAISLYDGATKIKRSAPDAVVDSFLGAYLVNRDDKEAALYQCKSGGDFSHIPQYRGVMAAREKQFSVGIAVTWSSLDVVTNGNTGTVTTELTKTLTNQTGRNSNSWRFDVVDQDGWRVCGATEQP